AIPPNWPLCQPQGSRYPRSALQKSITNCGLAGLGSGADPSQVLHTITSITGRVYRINLCCNIGCNFKTDILKKYGLFSHYTVFCFLASMRR
ncbi:MAG: hypothetical protein ACE14V_15315, partial [bacterium]